MIIIASCSIVFRITKLQEGGLIHKWKRDYLPRTGKCQGLDGGASASGVTVWDMQGSAYILICGLFLASVVFGLEFLIFKKFKSPSHMIPRPLSRAVSPMLHPEEAMGSRLSLYPTKKSKSGSVAPSMATLHP